jgi:hypothetical protein
LYGRVSVVIKVRVGVCCFEDWDCQYKLFGRIEEKKMAGSRSEYPAPFMKKDSFKSMREGFKEATRAELEPIDEDELQRKGAISVLSGLAYKAAVPGCVVDGE